ncbi:hypothetical protein [Lutibacter sp.]
MKKQLTSLFLFFTIVAFAQERNYTSIIGKIYSGNKIVTDAHIINLNNKLGSVSNDYGEFEINVKENDTLLISSIQYEKRKIRITKIHIKKRKLVIHLIPLVTVLDEVFLERLSGNLLSDLSKAPKDTIRHNFTFKASDLSKKLPVDQSGILSPPDAEAFTNPIYISGGGGTTIPDFYMIAKRKLKKVLTKKKQFPEKIVGDLGVSFFTQQLKIPKEKINNFLQYCEYKNIIEKYYKNDLLAVIQILIDESKAYNAIKN